jgi:tetratricopeptide (TPR) repeat protein
MPQATKNAANWTSTQAYGIAIVCLLLGVAVGYLLRSSGPVPAAAASQAPATQTAESPAGSLPQVTPEQLKIMADKQAEPVLGLLKARPNDPALLAQAGNIYYDAQQFREAIDYYTRSLQFDGNNANTRTDLGTAYWYLGDADRAIAEFDRVLRQEPTKTNALFNRGVVKWQGKMDIKGAVADWETLLKIDPNYRERPKVEQMLAQAKKHLNVKPGEKTSLPTM